MSKDQYFVYEVRDGVPPWRDALQPRAVLKVKAVEAQSVSGRRMRLFSFSVEKTLISGKTGNLNCLHGATPFAGFPEKIHAVIWARPSDGKLFFGLDRRQIEKLDRAEGFGIQPVPRKNSS